MLNYFKIFHLDGDYLKVLMDERGKKYLINQM